ncbi:hypothetical protein, partial [Marinobacter sp.]|uniref:hypothetical protein n=1 Tax=Marinobacter sp. TaxID=50741 RepID=UPI003563F291
LANRSVSVFLLFLQLAIILTGLIALPRQSGITIAHSGNRRHIACLTRLIQRIRRLRGTYIGNRWFERDSGIAVHILDFYLFPVV